MTSQPHANPAVLVGKCQTPTWAIESTTAFLQDALQEEPSTLELWGLAGPNETIQILLDGKHWVELWATLSGSAVVVDRGRQKGALRRTGPQDANWDRRGPRSSPPKPHPATTQIPAIQRRASPKHPRNGL
jgi:hypothetical protein